MATVPPEIKKEAWKALKDESFLSELLDNLSRKCDVRWSSFQILEYLSENHPEILYPRWDYLEDLFREGNSYTKYAVIYLIANLSKVDGKKKFNRFFEEYFSELSSSRTVTAAHAAFNSGKIAKAKPELREKITERLLEIDRVHKGRQKDIVKGYAIEAFSMFFEESEDRDKILDFVRRQLKSKSPRTKKLAKEFLDKWG